MSFLFVPVIANADNYTVKAGNQTIVIMMKPNDVIVKPTNTIIVKPNITVIESQNNPKNNTNNEQNSTSSINNLISQLPRSWTEGDVLIGSSTIFAFFSFGSFFIIKFENKRKDDLRIMLRRMQGILVSIFSVQLTQIYVIITIMFGIFSPLLFVLAMGVTALALYVILRSIRIILSIENQISEKYTSIRPKFKRIEQDILQRRIAETNIRRLIEQSRVLEENRRKLAELEKANVTFESNTDVSVKKDSDEKKS